MFRRARQRLKYFKFFPQKRSMRLRVKQTKTDFSERGLALKGLRTYFTEVQPSYKKNKIIN